MPHEPSPPDGWVRYIWWARSRKAQVALGAVIASTLSAWFGVVVAETALLGAIAAVISLILGIAHEDAASKQ